VSTVCKLIKFTALARSPWSATFTNVLGIPLKDFYHEQNYKEIVHTAAVNLASAILLLPLVSRVHNSMVNFCFRQKLGIPKSNHENSNSNITKNVFIHFQVLKGVQISMVV